VLGNASKEEGNDRVSLKKGLKMERASNSVMSPDFEGIQ